MSVSSKGPSTVHGRLPGRRQMLFNAALSVLAMSALPTASAQRDCWIDSFGRQHCRISLGARIAIAVAIVVVFLLLIIGIAISRRRRVQRANQAYVIAQQQQAQQAPPYGGYQYGNTPYDPTNANGGGAQYQQYQQYPPQGQGYFGQYGEPVAQGGYVPPPGPPPGSQDPPVYPGYNPPRSPPAAKV